MDTVARLGYFPARMLGSQRSLSWWWRSVLGRLLLACIVIFGIQFFGALRHTQQLEYLFGLSREGLAQGRFWQFVTFQFLHGNPGHLIANLVGIYCLGKPLMRVVGPRFILILWVVAGLMGGASQIAWNLGGVDPILLGASAAGFAYLVAFAVLFPNMRVIALFVPFPVKVWHFALGSVIATVGFMIFGAMPGVGHVAHLGGALAGWMAGKWIRPRLPMVLSGARGFAP